MCVNVWQGQSSCIIYLSLPSEDLWATRSGQRSDEVKIQETIIIDHKSFNLRQIKLQLSLNGYASMKFKHMQQLHTSWKLNYYHRKNYVHRHVDPMCKLSLMV